MKFCIKYWRTEQYLPTKRHRKLRSRYATDTMDVEIPEPKAVEFPVAFVIRNYKGVYENAKNYKDFDGLGDYRMVADELRTYQGKLYSVVRITYGTAISTMFEPLSYISDALTEREPWNYRQDELPESSIIVESNDEKMRSKILHKAEKFVVFEGKVWEECREPMYVVQTFGLGHNHGGTGFFVDDTYNPNISKRNYFTALQRDEATAYGREVAKRRGDTKYIDNIGAYCSIDVLMPEMVRHNPQIEHGNGDLFMNELEGLCDTSDSAMEAGLLVLAATRNLMKA